MDRRSHLSMLLVAALASTLALIGTAPSYARGGSSDWVTVSAGRFHTCAIRTDQRIYCWGKNAVGELGDGTTTERHVPVAVDTASLPSSLHTGWTSVSAGTDYTCARHKSGRIFCWGTDALGQLGDGGSTNRSVPTEVAGASTKWTAVVAGGYHACGRRTNGHLYCWGLGNSGELGNGASSSSATPVAVAGSTKWASVVVGGSHTCARRTNGRVSCWGYNGYGQLGDGTQTSRSRPTAVTGNSAWSAFAAGDSYTCAVGKTSKKTSCWGYNNDGQLGDGTTNLELVPTAISNTSTWSSVTTGVHITCARKTTGLLACWGENAAGEVGNDTQGSPQLTPVAVAGHATDWKVVSAGGFHVCAATNQGRLYCWGYNSNGQIGDNTTNAPLAPNEVYAP